MNTLGKRVVSAVTAVLMLGQAAIPVFAEEASKPSVVTITNGTSVGDVGNYVSDDGEIFTSINDSDLETLIKAWGRGTEPKFSIVEGDYNIVTYKEADTNVTNRKTLSWSTPDVSKWSNLEIKSRLWLSPYQKYANYTTEDWTKAYVQVQQYLWGTATDKENVGRDGELYKLAEEYDEIVGILSEDFEALYNQFRNVTLADIETAIGNLEMYVDEMELYGDLLDSVKGDSDLTTLLGDSMFEPWLTGRLVYNEDSANAWIAKHVANGSLTVQEMDFSVTDNTNNGGKLYGISLSAERKTGTVNYKYISISEIVAAFASEYMATLEDLKSVYTVFSDYDSMDSGVKVEGSVKGTTTAGLSARDYVLSQLNSMSLDEFTNSMLAVMKAYEKIETLNAFYMDTSQFWVYDFKAPFSGEFSETTATGGQNTSANVAIQGSVYCDSYSIAHGNASLFQLMNTAGTFKTYRSVSRPNPCSGYDANARKEENGYTYVGSLVAPWVEKSVAITQAVKNGEATVIGSNGVATTKKSTTWEALGWVISDSDFLEATGYHVSWSENYETTGTSGDNTGSSGDNMGSHVVSTPGKYIYNQWCTTYVLKDTIRGTWSTPTPSIVQTAMLNSDMTVTTTPNVYYVGGGATYRAYEYKTGAVTPPDNLKNAFDLLGRLHFVGTVKNTSEAVTEKYSFDRSDATAVIQGTSCFSWFNSSLNSNGAYGYRTDSPIYKYNQHIGSVFTTLNTYSDAREAVVNVMFDDVTDITDLWGMADLTEFLRRKPLMLSMLGGSWDYDATTEIVQKQVASVKKGLYDEEKGEAEDNIYQFTEYTAATDEEGNPIYYVGQYEATPWVSYSLTKNSGMPLYSSDYTRNEIGKASSTTGNPTHPESHSLTESDVLKLNDLGLISDIDTYDYENGKFKLTSVIVNVSRVDMTDSVTSGANSVLRREYTGSDMYNIDLHKLVEELKTQEWGTIPSGSVSNLRSALTGTLHYSSDKVEEVINSYYSMATAWNSETGYRFNINYNYELALSDGFVVTDLQVDNLDDDMLYVIPEYSISEYYDSIFDSLSDTQMSEYYGDDTDFSSVVSAIRGKKENPAPTIISYQSAQPVTWYNQLHKVGINSLYNNNKELKTGEVKTAVYTANSSGATGAGSLSIPAESVDSKGMPIPAMYLYYGGQKYPILGRTANRVTWDMRYYILSCDANNATDIYTVGKDEVVGESTAYSNYRDFIGSIAQTYQPVSAGVSVREDVMEKTGAGIGKYAATLDTSALRDKDEGVLKFTPATGNSQVFYAVQEAQGGAGQLQKVRKVSRMMFPIVQYTVGIEEFENTNYNLNNHLYSVNGQFKTDKGAVVLDKNGEPESTGGTLTKGNYLYGVNAGALRAFVTEESLPVLQWDSNGFIRNIYNEKMSTRWDADIHLWISKSTNEDGVYVADWKNTVPLVFNTPSTDSLLRSTNTQNGYTAAHASDTSVTSIYKPSHIEWAHVEGAVGSSDGSGSSKLKQSILLTTTPTTGTFSDWMFGKTSGRTGVYYWCKNCHQVVDDVREHALDWSTVVHTTTKTYKTTSVTTSSCCGGTHNAFGETFNVGHLTINVPIVKCEGQFYDIGFWNMDYLDPNKAEYIDLSGLKFEWYVSKPVVHNSSGGGGGLDWSTDHNGNITITGTSVTPGGYSGGYTPEELEEQYATAKAKAYESATQALAEHPGAKLKVQELGNGIVYWLDKIPMGGQLEYWRNNSTYTRDPYWGGVEDDTRMGYGASLTEPYGIYNFMSRYRVGGSAAPVLVDNAGGLYAVSTYGSSQQLYEALLGKTEHDLSFMDDPKLTDEEKAELWRREYPFEEYDVDGQMDSKAWYDGQTNAYKDTEKMERSGLTLKNVNNVSAYTATKCRYNVTRVSTVAYMSVDELSKVNNFNGGYHNYRTWSTDTSSSGAGVTLTPTPYTPPVNSIAFHIDCSPSLVGSLSGSTVMSNTSTTEQQLPDGTTVITTHSESHGSENDRGHAHTTVTDIVLTINIQRFGPGPAPYLPIIQEANRICQPSDTGSFAISTIEDDQAPMNGSMVAQTVDGDTKVYYERSGVLVSERAGQVWMIDPMGNERVVSDTNVHELEIWSDNVTYYPMIFVKNISKAKSKPDSDQSTEPNAPGQGLYNPKSTAIRVTANIANDEILGEHQWQTDILDYTNGHIYNAAPATQYGQAGHTDNQRAYNVVPEVLMTYKTDYIGATAKEQYKNRGKLGSLYIAAYNNYRMAFPAYHNIKVNCLVDDVEAQSSAVAQTANAEKLKAGVPVWYTGAEANVTYTLNPTEDNRKLVWHSYILDFTTEAQKVAEAWNEGYDPNNAVLLADSYFNSFKDVADGDTAATLKEKPITMTGIMTNTYAVTTNTESTVDGESENSGGNDDTINTAKTKDITVENDFDLNTVDKTNAYHELVSLPITIRNARLAGISIPNNFGATVDKANETTSYNYVAFPTRIDGTSEALKATAEFKQLAADYPDVAEAILNMKLQEFAATFVHSGGSESWDKFKEQKALGKGYVPSTTADEENVQTAIGDYVSSVKSGSEKDFSASDNWYAEDCTVLRIRMFEQSAVLPDMLVFTWKIPVDYGWKAPANASGLFADGKKAIYGYCELGVRFRNTWFSTAAEDAKPDGVDKLNSAGWDIIGNEYTGDFKVGTKPLFVIHNASVNDMYN